MILPFGTCHLPKLKILEHAAGIKETDVIAIRRGEGRRGGRGGDAVRFRKRYEIRNWARDTPTAPVCVGRGGWAFCFAREERREVGGSLLCSLPGKSAADVPTRLARARCHLAARKTVPSAPFLVPPLRPSPPPYGPGAPAALLSLDGARARSMPPRGSDTKLLSATSECTHRRSLYPREWLLLTYRRLELIRRR